MEDFIMDKAELAAFVIEVIKAHEQQKAEQKILVKYAENIFGKAAVEFGLPKYTYFAEDAGIDLPVVLDEEHRESGLTIYPGDRAMLHSGLLIEPPHGYWSRIIHRSSTEKRHRLRVIEGVIDAGYRNEIITQVHNSNSFPIVVKHGQRIAQLILCPLVCFQIELATELSKSARGKSGFGSSGV